MSAFVHVEFKLGNMRKAVDWLVTPSADNANGIVTLQSDRRIIRVDLNIKKAVLSSGKGGTYSNTFMHLSPALGATVVDVPDDVVEKIRTAVNANPQIQQNSVRVL